jgi:D-arabinose 1-dehydrogenase-like Zn-dependent alcohol dehydrogenase
MEPRMIGLQRPGGYADHLIVPHARYLIDTTGIDPLWAATLSCSGVSSYAAASKLAPIPPEEWIAVIGAGGLGLSAVAMLRAMGHRRIVAVDVDREKLCTAEKAGATATLNTHQGDPELQLKSITNHALFGAIDFVGATQTAQLAISCLRKGGRLILVGLFGGEIPLSIAGTILRAITVRGSHLGSIEELRTVIGLARAGKIQPIPIEKRGFADLNRTLDQLKNGTVTGRVVIAI